MQLAWDISPFAGNSMKVEQDRSVGITTTVPCEVIYAAGFVPVDLNNLFISDPEREELVYRAERAGFPNNTCAWIKGLYSTVLKHGIKRVVAVNQGDCSNTQALMEILTIEGIDVIPFGYPYGRDRRLMANQLSRLEEALGAEHEEAEIQKRRLDSIRAKALALDEETWRERRITGFENHLYLVSCSDFEGDPEGFGKRIDDFLLDTERRITPADKVRLGYVGVPPIYGEIYSHVEQAGGQIVYNETQRQFAMPHGGDTLVDQYLRYTYPYDIFSRIEDIEKEIARRELEGIVHYVQSFCFRQISDVILRKVLPVPVLTIEADLPGKVESLNMQKVEIFVDMVRRRCRKGKKGT